MKELSVEQKVTRYDKALDRAKKELQVCGSQDCDAARQIFRLFPELAESEDERIRKALIDGFTVMKESKNCGKTFSNHNIPVEDILSWLEKQGEQKPAWSEEDESMLFNVIHRIEQLDHYWNKPTDEKMIDWLKSLKERVLPQPKWKPSDEQIRELSIVSTGKGWFSKEILSELLEQLKKLREE